MAVLSLGTLCWAGSERQDAVGRLNRAATVVHEMMNAPDQRTDVKLDTIILTYSRAKGAFRGLAFTGALVRADNNSRRAMYGPRVTTRATLLGRVAAPAAAEPFLDAASGARAQAIVTAR